MMVVVSPINVVCLKVNLVNAVAPVVFLVMRSFTDVGANLLLIELRALLGVNLTIYLDGDHFPSSPTASNTK